MENPPIRGILWLKLDAVSRERLLAAYPPKYEAIFCDHITLLFDVPKEDVISLLGRKESAQVYAYARNQQIEAVRVRTNLPDTYGVPHITLSAKAGVNPFESVAMLRKDHIEAALDTPLEVTGLLEFVPLPA